MVERSNDWLAQADRDLAQAKESLKDGFYEWACFAAQQSAEKAAKAVYQSIHVDVIGHSVSRMLRDSPTSLKPDDEIIRLAQSLDRHYVPSRYPNSHPEGAPKDYYTEQDAAQAVNGAEKIVGYCRSKIP